MSYPYDNRAVSLLFRAFGNSEVIAGNELQARERGMHRGEFYAFSALIPLTTAVALGEWLVKWLGLLLGGALILPVSFVILQILPFLFVVKRRSLQWMLWILMFVVWAFCRREASGIVGFFAYLWIGIGLLSIAASFWLLWKSNAIFRLLLGIFLHLAAIWIGMKFGWHDGLLCGASIAALFCWSVLKPSCQWLGTKQCTSGNDKILITIDDGPDPKDTPTLLDLLDQYQMKAIFFMIGEKAQAHPELVREVLRRGHEIGNHTMTHPQATFWSYGPWRTKREILKCQEVLESITGQKPHWFRAPVGHFNLFVHPILQKLDLKAMAWNRRGYDAVESDSERALVRILPHLKKGDIVLLHEATPIAATVLEGVLKKSTQIIPENPA